MGNKIKMIEITEENFDWIASRLVKFFNGKDIVYWHNFDCGSKRHIQSDFNMSSGILTPEHRVRPVYLYFEVKCRAIKRVPIMEGAPPRKFIRVTLNRECGDVIYVGHKVGFAGNRIHVKSKSIVSDYKFQYDVYQIWDPNGGFKDLKASHDDWPINDFEYDDEY